MTHSFNYFVGNLPAEIPLHDFIYMVRDTVGVKPVILKESEKGIDFRITVDDNYVEGCLDTIRKDMGQDIQYRTGLRIY